MKNMDYEKKYNEALNWMRELYPGLHGTTKEDAEHYFPELKESEDERIRKFICSIIDNLEPKDFVGVKKMNVIAWLERQKEQIPYIDFVIKPHKGDDTNPYDMGVSEAQDYATHRGFDIPFNDGEVYVDERHITQTVGNILRWADEHPKEQKPITINQDDKEFLANEVTAFLCNYDKEFDGEDPVPSEIAEHFYLLGKQAQEQKPTDEQFPPLEGLDAIKAKYYDDGFKNGFDEGVESVKPAEWSEEDIDIINVLEYIVGKHRPNEIFKIGNKQGVSAYKICSWLKSLKDRGNFPKSNTNSPSEWSEEDKQNYKVICSIIHGTYVIETQEMQDKLLSWLKSLKPQPMQEQKPEAKFTGWVARDREFDSYLGLGLILFKGKPRRSGECWSGAIAAQLPWELFPDLKWEDEPLEVEIIIRKK